MHHSWNSRAILGAAAAKSIIHRIVQECWHRKYRHLHFQQKYFHFLIYETAFKHSFIQALSFLRQQRLLCPDKGLMRVKLTPILLS